MNFELDGISYRLKEPEDFSWLSVYGRCFKIYDQLTSGNICFCMDGSYGKLFIKYAGARTVNCGDRPRDAVQTLRKAIPFYQEKRKGLVQLLNHGPINKGYALIFRYQEGEILHNQETLNHLHHLPLYNRLSMLDTLFNLQAELEEYGLFPVDFSDENILIDFENAAAVQCDIDQYTTLPCVNESGRMPGIFKYLAPEEYEKGAKMSGATAVYRLGILALEFFCSSFREPETWTASEPLYQVAMKAVNEEPMRRYPSVAAFLKAWREAVGKSRSR